MLVLEILNLTQAQVNGLPRKVLKMRYYSKFDDNLQILSICEFENGKLYAGCVNGTIKMFDFSNYTKQVGDL